MDWGVPAPSKWAGRLIEYTNTPGIIGTLISARLATLNELQTVYGPLDAYNLFEVHMIDQTNRQIIEEAQ